MLLTLSNMITNYTLHKFFTISNLIEGIEDNEEVKRQVSMFERTPDKKYPLEYFMFLFHASMGYLNGYCKAGELRTYPVYVGGRECREHSEIVPALHALFYEYPKTYKEIKDWHIRFEHIHPFGD